MDDVSYIIDLLSNNDKCDDDCGSDCGIDVGGCPCEDCSSNDNGCDYDYDCGND